MTKIYTEVEAAEFLRIGNNTLYNLRKRHKIAFIKGRPIRYMQEHLDDYLAQAVIKPKVK